MVRIILAPPPDAEVVLCQPPLAQPGWPIGQARRAADRFNLSKKPGDVIALIPCPLVGEERSTYRAVLLRRKAGLDNGGNPR